MGPRLVDNLKKIIREQAVKVIGSTEDPELKAAAGALEGNLERNIPETLEQLCELIRASSRVRS